MMRHGGVDLAGKLDEAGRNTIFPRFPRQIEGIDRNAVSTKTGSRIERHVAKGLRLGRLDHFPDIDAHGVIDELELVHESDIDGPEHVLGDLYRFTRFIRPDDDDFLHDAAIQPRSEIPSSLS